MRFSFTNVKFFFSVEERETGNKIWNAGAGEREPWNARLWAGTHTKRNLFYENKKNFFYLVFIL